MQMREMINIIPIGLYFIVGAISLVMAAKSLFFKKFIPFHAAAAKRPWDQVERPLQLVILVLMRVSGLGFLVVALLLMVFPTVNYFQPNTFVKYAIPGIALLYCTGLFLANYHLYK